MGRAVISEGAWTYLVPWPGPRDGPGHADLAADAATRDATALYLGLEAVTRLDARLTLHPWRDGVEITGRLRGAVIRLCGVTLESFEEIIDEEVFLRAVPEGSAHAPAPPAAEVDLDLAGEDPPEVLGPAGVDLGDLMVQTLALALDPYPRKPGAVFAPPPARPEDSPFGVLGQLIREEGAKD
jgi:hypothetical protein